jgi:Rubrerythrin
LVEAAAQPPLQEVLAGAWAVRYRIETEASLRFGSLARRLEGVGAPRALVELADRASKDETRHAAHCARLFRGLGGTNLTGVDRVVEYAPRSLPERERLTYELVAQCCVAETQSTATLVTLLDAAETLELRSVLHELARDEVHHSRLGWAYLAWARPRVDFTFLGPLLPGMIAGSAGPEIFEPPAGEADRPELLRQGVVPHSMRRQVYIETLENVVFPGFDTVGVDTAPVRRWLGEKLAATPASSR